MPSLSFQKQFVPGIRAMLDKEYAFRLKIKPKTTTIRKLRKRPFKKGDRLVLFSGLRTKFCEKLGEVRCKKVELIVFEDIGLPGTSCYLVTINGAAVGYETILKIAKQDGFKDANTMMEWFKKNHGFPFTGQRIFMDNTYDRKFYLHKRVKDLELQVKLTKLEKTIEITSDEVAKLRGSKYVTELMDKHQYGVQIINPLFK